MAAFLLAFPREMVTHMQPVLCLADLCEFEALAALKPEDISATFVARRVSVQELSRANGHRPRLDARS